MCDVSDVCVWHDHVRDDCEYFLKLYFISTFEITSDVVLPLTEEIRLKIFGFPDLPVFLIDLLSAGGSVYSCEILFKILGTPVITCLICTGTPVKTCWKFWQS